MPTKKYDTVVVGAGPSGLLAAKAAAENGLSVALLEKKSAEDMRRLTRSCAQTILSMREPYMDNIVNYNARDKRLCFSADGVSFNYTGPYKNIYAWYFYAPDGHLVRLGIPDEGRAIGDDARTAIVHDKSSLFQNLLDELKDLNVDIFPGVNVDGVETGSDGATVSAGGQSFTGRYVIAADGVNSRIAGMLGFNKDRYFWCVLSALSYYMRGVDVPDPNVVITSTGYFGESTGLFFVAPRPVEGEYNVQFMGIDPRLDLKQSANYFMKDAFSAPWFKNAEILETFSAKCNCYDPIAVPFKGSVLLIGDTASTQEIENTGAMLCGWRAGNGVATAIREEKLGLEVTGVEGYLKWWKDIYIDGYNHEGYMKNWILGIVLTEAEEMNYTFNLIKDPLPANFNPYTGPKMMGRTMGKLGPTIARERPDIVQKMGKLRIPLKEAYAEITRLSKPVYE